MHSTSRLFPFFGIVVFAALLALEVVARHTTPESAWPKPRHVWLSEADLELDALPKGAEWNPDRSARYDEESPYARQPAASAHVNFTENYPARLTPSSAPLEGAEHSVWGFGGSSMEGTGTTDSVTLADLVLARLDVTAPTP
jgi:hypothetical protein